MTDDLRFGTKQMLQSLGVRDRAFREFPEGMDWNRARRHRQAFYRPMDATPHPPVGAPAIEPIDNRELSGCWDDLIEAGLAEVGWKVDGFGEPISGFGFNLTEKGVEAVK